jgi:hypothetical protein
MITFADGYLTANLCDQKLVIIAKLINLLIHLWHGFFTGRTEKIEKIEILAL